MPDITELGLAPEPIAEIDYNAPEPGAFPPQIKPGRYTFVFHLGPVNDSPEADYFDAIEIEVTKGQPKVKFLQVLHHATTTVQGTNNFGEVDSHDVTLNYQRVNAYKHPKMPNSSLGDLIRALGLQVTGALTPQAVAQLLKEVDGRKSYEAGVVWRAFCKTCNTTMSTAARTKKGEVQWPKPDAAGNMPEMCECPTCHQKYFGQPEIARYYLPQPVAATTA